MVVPNLECWRSPPVGECFRAKGGSIIKGPVSPHARLYSSVSSPVISNVRWAKPLCPTAASSQVSYASQPVMKSREKCLCFSVSTYLSNLLGTGMRRFLGVYYLTFVRFFSNER